MGRFQFLAQMANLPIFHERTPSSPAIIVGRKGSYGKVNWTDEACFASDTTFVVDGANDLAPPSLDILDASGIGVGYGL